MATASEHPRLTRPRRGRVIAGVCRSHGPTRSAGAAQPTLPGPRTLLWEIRHTAAGAALLLLAGVCAGIARRYGWSPWGVRLVFLVSCLLPGPQIVLYVALWILMPKEPKE